MVIFYRFVVIKDAVVHMGPMLPQCIGYVDVRLVGTQAQYLHAGFYQSLDSLLETVCSETGRRLNVGPEAHRQ